MHKGPLVLTALLLGLTLAGSAAAQTLDQYALHAAQGAAGQAQGQLRPDDVAGSVGSGTTLSIDIVRDSPGFTEAALSYGQERAQPYEDQLLAQLDAGTSVARGAFEQANAATCPACHVGTLQGLLAPSETATLDLAAQADAPATVALAHGFAALEGAKQGATPDAAWACPATQESWGAMFHDALPRDGATLAAAGADYLAREVPAPPPPADGLGGVASGARALLRDVPGMAEPDFPTTC
ncbi:MAG: hypothetical protein LC624_01010 [Halobacteriales archaeon]|nr:hypothetical protein [Halobacteriales archaeon]